MSDRLRPLWDFDDLDATERRLRLQLECEQSDPGRSEVLTQLGRRSSGDAEASIPLFEAAFERASRCGEGFLAADAAHMVAMVDPEKMPEWTERGLQLADSDPEASYWAGPLLNNLGWHHFENGDYGAALRVFERALQARERDLEKRAEIEIARYAIGKTLRLLGRPTEAAAVLEQCLANSEPDPYFHEELCEIYTVLGRDEDARQQAELAARLR